MVVLIVLALVLATAFVAWLAGAGSGAPSFKEASFRDLGTARTSMDFQLTRDPDDTVVCAIQALNDEHAVVGWKEVTVPPTPGENAVRRTVDLRTTGHAVSATVDSCWVTN